jgi:transposase
VKGVGQLTAPAFVLLLRSHALRKKPSGRLLRGAGTRKDPSGDSDLQRHICRYGNELLRRLLVGCAHYILGPFEEGSDLRRNGEKIAQRGGKNAKKRAAVALARKRAVLFCTTCGFPARSTTLCTTPGEHRKGPYKERRQDT